MGPVAREYRRRLAMKPKSTRFMNAKHRVIMKTAQGKFIVKTNKGIKYNPKAKYYKNPAGSTVATKYVKNLTNIPSPIRPKFNRKERKNSGAARGKYAPRAAGMRVLPVKRAAHIGSMFEGYAPKRRAGRPRKYLVSPGGNMGLAKLFGGKPVRKERKRHEGLPVPRKRKAKKSPLARLIASLY